MTVDSVDTSTRGVRIRVHPGLCEAITVIELHPDDAP